MTGVQTCALPISVIHITIKPTSYSSAGFTAESTRDEQERKLQDVVDSCAENGVLVTRVKRNWDQEMVEHKPSLRICVSSALSKKEIEKAGAVLKAALIKTLGKGRK